MRFDDLKFWLEEQLSNLDKQQRTLALIVVPAGLVLILLFLVSYPLVSAKENCERKQLLFREKVNKIKRTVVEYEKLMVGLAPIKMKIKAAKQFDPSVFLKSRFQKLGVKVKSVKIVNSGSWNGFRKYALTVSFAESSLNNVARAVFEVENSKYYFKSSSIEISDEDGNGLVSGKVSFNFYRSKE